MLGGLQRKSAQINNKCE